MKRIALLLITVAALAGSPSGPVTLQWDASLSPGVMGYRVYSGTVSGQYTNAVVDVGNVLTFTATNLTVSTTNYFAVTAYDSNRVESVPSNEAATYVKVAPPGNLKAK